MSRILLKVTPLLIFILIFSGVGSFAASEYKQYTVTAEQGKAAAEAAKDYAEAGVPFKLGGQATVTAFAEAEGEEVGIDASGLVVNVYREVIGEIAWAGGGGEEPLLFKDISSSNLFNWNTIPVELGELRPGDLIFFQNSQGKIAGVAIFLEQKGDLVHFIVPSASQGQVIETFLNVNHDYWKDRFAGAGRMTYWQK